MLRSFNCVNEVAGAHLQVLKLRIVDKDVRCDLATEEIM
jgi:hypothetical protein